MNTQLRQNKATIRAFMRANYTDGKLIELLEHARSGKLAFYSCCCFIGVPTADHELQPSSIVGAQHSREKHYGKAVMLPGAKVAEEAYRLLSPYAHDGSPIDYYRESDPLRRRILIPMILAEIRRRRMAQSETPATVEVEHAEI
jgi:hypothetical protein